MLRNQRVYLKLEGPCPQWFQLQTTESAPCSSAPNSPGTDVPVEVASGLCFLISAHTATWKNVCWFPLGFRQLLRIYNYCLKKETAHYCSHTHVSCNTSHPSHEQNLAFISPVTSPMIQIWYAIGTKLGFV